jgi:hypothetical protein
MLIKNIIRWFATVGTILVLGDDLLGLYKIIEFRGAIHDGFEFAGIIGLFVMIGISTMAVIFCLLSFNLGLRRYDKFGRLSCVVAALCALVVLLLNGIELPEWLAQALAGRNFSAAWCLMISLATMKMVHRTQ